MPHPPASLPERAMPGRSFRLRARVVAGLFCAVCLRPQAANATDAAMSRCCWAVTRPASSSKATNTARSRS